MHQSTYVPNWNYNCSCLGISCISSMQAWSITIHIIEYNSLIIKYFVYNMEYDSAHFMLNQDYTGGRTKLEQWSKDPW